MERKIIKTADGSVTIHLPEWDEQYHSKHGAVQEAQHVFIKMGLHHFLKQSPKPQISILEIGFGTGLNAFITFLEAQNLPLQFDYTGVEAYPVTSEEIAALNYAEMLSAGSQDWALQKMHNCPWGQPVEISDNFKLKKLQKKFDEITIKDEFEIIYFDAFGARVQPELWTEEIFEIMYSALKEGGILVTYSAKGSVRRALQKVGFIVERLPGPPGKREMLRATKN
ncbi:MAG: tRNA (5-methylaminomethyl-2-thiouridine)(34)-methyltransferase MnmD [Salegentibacter sp.]|uniref:tRNA U34 5-methylaminomethyl-2-thiouridine-forming methyltransferase MnmC n=1 Tax=Salegentibacter flavus TaxID=287099 RepID=A0A1I4ZFD5_9FLAO|nr:MULTISPECIES: tRNA (5-methylaminomethyl-2-thiouridine)(34)-methyltransferase MnmD [Salegentibacter]MDR9456773.1 tRNA (5-methylaminomethyl-2-thiouridine)(34)-methyltransferase MnmD [Salegentibacter sp.]SFN48972.1 tRNA U34 5-methylaminomethyl-2-thiouridine-forming methyltransferase MnmC [Salegentibacter flavus]